MPKMRKVVQKTRSGQFIAIYDNATHASKETGIGKSSILRSCKGIGDAGGYRFFWLSETTVPEEFQPQHNEDIG